MNANQNTLRLMFYNIYGYKWYPDREHSPHLHSGPVTLRQSMEAELIGQYKPDVLGMQEYCAAFHKTMTPLLLQGGYTQIDVWNAVPDKKGNPVNFTPLFYRADRLRVCDMGYRLYTGPNDVDSKSLTWAIFKDLRNGKQFVAICTHLMYHDPALPDRGDAARLSDVAQLLEILAGIDRKTGGGLPVIMGGDLNCFVTEPPCTALREGGFTWAYDAAAEKNDSRGVKSYATYDEEKGEYITCPVPDNDPYRAIDSVWLRQGDRNRFSLLSYLALTDRNAFLASDHCPRLLDAAWADTEVTQ